MGMSIVFTAGLPIIEAADGRRAEVPAYIVAQVSEELPLQTACERYGQKIGFGRPLPPSSPVDICSRIARRRVPTVDTAFKSAA